MSLYAHPIDTLDGKPGTLEPYKGQVLLLVNVASRCGLTPQYTALEALHERFNKRGFSVLGFPCNQFGAQEPGTPEEIATFCSTTFGVTFPIFEKVEVNGTGRHPIYQQLVETKDDAGTAGDVVWNFEKFLVGSDGSVLARFRPPTTPDDPAVIEAIETALKAV